MTDESEQKTVEISVDLARDIADLAAFQAKSHYKHNATTWGDTYHSIARKVNDAVGDDWSDVGIERYEKAGETDV
jgi:hypothetical protein